MAEKLHAETDTQQSSEDAVLTVTVRRSSVTFDLQYMDYLCLTLNAVVAVDATAKERAVLKDVSSVFRYILVATLSAPADTANVSENPPYPSCCLCQPPRNKTLSSKNEYNNVICELVELFRTSWALLCWNRSVLVAGSSYYHSR